MENGVSAITLQILVVTRNSGIEPHVVELAASTCLAIACHRIHKLHPHGKGSLPWQRHLHYVVVWTASRDLACFRCHDPASLAVLFSFVESR